MRKCLIGRTSSTCRGVLRSSQDYWTRSSGCYRLTIATTLTFRWPHSVILAKEGPNDGLVSVQSAQWGEYRGTLLGVNHLDLVGWVNHVRYAFSNWSGNPISFKPATFYLEVVSKAA